jgi:hypothetical protein
MDKKPTMKKIPLVLLVYLAAALRVSAQMHISQINAQQHDTTHPAVYIMLSGGFSQPNGNDYGGSYYSIMGDPYPHSGYASSGTSFSLLSGIDIWRGWGLEGMFSLYRHRFDATGFFNQEGAFMDDEIINNNNTSIYFNNTMATGTYSYSLYSFLLGITKDWKFGIVRIGASMMAGKLTTTRPDIQGTADISVYDGGNFKSGNYNWNIDSYSESDFLFDMGMHCSISFTKHFFVRSDINLQVSSFSELGNFEITDMNGNTLWDHNLPSSYRYLGTPGLSVGLANATLGVGYRF